MNWLHSFWQKFSAFISRVRQEIFFVQKKKTLLGPPGSPLFDPETLSVFNAYITAPATRVYLEYGSGGATLIAAQNVELVVSVESDAYYQGLVKEALDSAAVKSDIHLLYGDIGITGGWGTPLIRAAGYAFSGKKYVQAPWRLIEREQRKVDFVLVDGRFRVACVCASLLNPYSSEAYILLDDFAVRPAYNAILDFADIVEQNGRSVLLKKKRDFDEVGCRALLNKSMRKHL